MKENKHNKKELDKVWKNCLKMWKWIVQQIDKGSELGVERLKMQWLETHGYKDKYIIAACFFCDYSKTNIPIDESDICLNCPGKLVDRRFCCGAVTYDYYKKPKKFYQKLLQLDAKRRMNKC